MPRFTDQVVIITGASLGVGRACARAFFAEGAKVVLTARRQAPLEAVATELGDPERVLVQPCDVGDDASLKALVEATMARFGRIDGLVNNAGAHFRGEVTARTADEMSVMVDVNLRGPLVLTRLCLDQIRENGGFVVQVASLAGKLALEGSATYSATKFGLRAFSFALAEELRDEPVRIGVVSPGPISTGFILDELHTVSDITLSQDMCSAEHVASMVLDTAADGVRERAWPPMGARLATLAYLFPGLRRMLKPRLEAKGRRHRARLERELSQDG